MLKIITTFLSLLPLLTHSTPVEDVNTLLSDKDGLEIESQILDLLEDKETSVLCTNEMIQYDIFSRLLNLKYLDSLAKLFELCGNTDVFEEEDLHPLFENLSLLKQKVKLLVDSSKLLPKQELAIVVPAFEWAQSGDEVFVSVKFAHKLDTPPCIDLDGEEVILDKNHVSVSANCRNQKRRFELKLPLWDEINHENSSFSMKSVGRGLLTLVKKKPQSVWTSLLEKGVEKPKNMHTWWELNVKYERELANIKANKEGSSPPEKSDDSKAEEEEKKPVLTDFEKQKKRDKKAAKKMLKSEKNKIKKQMKDRIRLLDIELEDEHNRMKRDKNAKVREIEKEKGDKLAELDQKYKLALEEIDKRENSVETQSFSPTAWLKSFFASAPEEGTTAETDEPEDTSKPDL